MLDTDEETITELMTYFGGSEFGPMQFAEGVKYILKYEMRS